MVMLWRVARTFLAIMILSVALFVYAFFRYGGMDTLYLMFNGEFTVSSTSFTHMGELTNRYTCYGKAINPALDITGVPRNAVSLVFILDEPYYYSKGIYTNWILWNIPPDEPSFPESGLPQFAYEGNNSEGVLGYKAPCPPFNVKRNFYFKVYALDTEIELETRAPRIHVIREMKGHVIGYTFMIGVAS